MRAWLLLGLAATAAWFVGCAKADIPATPEQRAEPTPPLPPEPEPEPKLPAPPPGLHVSAAGPEFIEWSWNAVEGTIGYVVQTSRDEIWTDADPIAATVATTYRVSDLLPDTAVYLRVAAAVIFAEEEVLSAWTPQVTGR